LKREPSIVVVGSADSPGAAIDMLAETMPDLVLLDVGMPSALPAVRLLAETFPGPKVVALGVSESREDVVACAESGASGYVCRQSSMRELVETLERVMANEVVCEPRIAAALIYRLGTLADRRFREPEKLHITPRQLEIVALINDGLSNKQIASRLNIEVSTVKNHVHNILEKLGTHRRGTAAAMVRRAGLLLNSRPTAQT